MYLNFDLFLCMFRGLVGRKNLTSADMNPVLEKLKEHLVAKNVAVEIATKLCDSVSSKLEGKVNILILILFNANIWFIMYVLFRFLVHLNQ